MPYAAPRICKCGVVVRGACPACTKAYDATRGSARQRGYDSQWQSLRGAFLKAHPTCITCGKPATDVDHIQSVRERPDLRLNWHNLRAMCHACHSARTNRDQVHRGGRV